MMKCFVTVGTTKFDGLVSAVTEKDFLETLTNKGFASLNIQYGSSELEPSELPSHPSLVITCFKYKPTIEDDIEDADLIISHAGAGSCLEIMYAKKPCIVVVNDKLMGNHQTELADQLQKMNHVKYTTPRNLLSTFVNFNPNSLDKYERGKPERFSEFLQQVTGV